MYHAECYCGHNTVIGAIHPLLLSPAALSSILPSMVSCSVYPSVPQLGRQPVAGLARVRVHDACGPLLLLDELHQILCASVNLLMPPLQHSLSSPRNAERIGLSKSMVCTGAAAER